MESHNDTDSTPYPKRGNTVDDVIEKLPINWTHIFVAIAASLGFLFDSFDTYIVSYAMPSIIKERNNSPIINGLLTSAGIWGMFLGAILWGPITDKLAEKSDLWVLYRFQPVDRFNFVNY